MNAPTARPGWRRWLRKLERVFAGIGIILIIYHIAFELTVIVSPSMAPTLQGTGYDDGDWVLCERLTYRFRAPRRWELVAFYNRESLHVIKRVAGLPGESISLRDGRVVIGGSVHETPVKVRYYAFGQLRGSGGVEVPPEFIYVLGDDSRDSADSRFEGPLPLQAVRARPLLRVWPPERIGWVNP